MKLYINRLMLTIAMLTFGQQSRGAENKAYPDVALVGPGSGKNPMSRDQFVILVVEGPFISHEARPIPPTEVVSYVDNLLKINNVSYLAVHAREGVKYGDVVRAMDVLRKTNARQIGISMIELREGREP